MYSWRDVKAAYTPEKSRNDLVCHPWFFLLRPVSFPLAAVLANLRVPPTRVTEFGILVLFGAYALLVTGPHQFDFTLFGILLLLLWNLLDCIDGDMARVTGAKSARGSHLDFLAGQLFHPLTPCLLVVGLTDTPALESALLPEPLTQWMLHIALVEAFFQLLRVVVSQRAQIKLDYDPGARPTHVSIAQMIPRAPLNFRAPLLLACYIFDLIPEYLLFYAVYSLGLFMVVLHNTLRRTRAADQSRVAREG